MKRLLVLQHVEIEGPGLFEQFAKERDLKIEIIRLDKKDKLPQTKKGDLILIMGAGDINMICASLFLKLINNKSIKNNLAA